MATSSSVLQRHRHQLLFALCIFLIGSLAASQSITSDSPQQASPHDRPATHSAQLGTPPSVVGVPRVHPEARSSSSTKPVGTVQKLLKTPTNGLQKGHPHLSQSPHEPTSSPGGTKLSEMHKNQLPVGVFNTLDPAASIAGPAPPGEDPLDILTSSGRYLGFTNQSTHQVDTWLGIRYAEPPVGDLRFRAPILLEKPLNGQGDIQPAFKFGDACPQEPFDNQLDVEVSEDCLYLNVYRPSNSQARSPMPVLVWIHGGALTYGTAAEVDGAVIVSSSVDMKKPIIFVSLNYRLNSFGFLNTDDLPLEDLQVGLQDQITCLKWLKLNIQAFGGDPDRVTIWGQSAGAFSVSLLATYLHDTPSSSLFRAAIMNSGSPTSHTVPAVSVYDRPGMPYSLLLEATGCNSQPSSWFQPEFHSHKVERLECLRRLDYDILLNATLSIRQSLPFARQLTIWGPSFKLGSIIDKRPSQRLKENIFLKIPMIIGTNKDEGTLSAVLPLHPHPASSINPDTYFQAYMSNSSVLDLHSVDPKVYHKVSRLYPDQPSRGSPFDTNFATFGQPQIFKRMAAWFGDLHYQAPRRLWAQKASSETSVYVYYFDGPPPSNETPHAGVAHSSELPLIYGNSKLEGLPDEERRATSALARKIREHYIRFVYDLNPGDDWPQYRVDGKKVRRFNKLVPQGELIADDWRVEQTRFLNSQSALDTYMT